MPICDKCGEEKTSQGLRLHRMSCEGKNIPEVKLLMPSSGIDDDPKLEEYTELEDIEDEIKIPDITIDDIHNEIENAVKPIIDFNKRLLEMLQNLSTDQRNLGQEMATMRSEAISIKKLTHKINELRLENRELKEREEIKMSKELKEKEKEERREESDRLSQLEDEKFTRIREEEKRVKEEMKQAKLAIANQPRVLPFTFL